MSANFLTNQRIAQSKLLFANYNIKFYLSACKSQILDYFTKRKKLFNNSVSEIFSIDFFSKYAVLKAKIYADYLVQKSKCIICYIPGLEKITVCGSTSFDETNSNEFLPL